VFVSKETLVYFIIVNTWCIFQVDFSADDNGLWAIYSIEKSNNTAVAKVDTLKIYVLEYKVPGKSLHRVIRNQSCLYGNINSASSGH
jgi:hypothetical protein